METETIGLALAEGKAGPDRVRLIFGGRVS